MPAFELQPSDSEKPYSVEIKPIADSEYSLQIDDTTYSLQLYYDAPEAGWVRNVETGEITPFYLAVSPESAQLWVRGRTYTFALPSSQARAKRATGGATTAASGDIKAPMPGTVLKILVNPGDKVETNAPLLIMESMKMEMTLSAPCDSWISGISCEVGELVEMNTVLIELEAVADEPVLS